MAQRAILYRMETDDHICPFGLKSRSLLKRNGFDLDDKTFNSRDEVDSFQQEYNVDTTPQIFIDGVRIGGYEELRNYLGMEQEGDSGTTYKPVVAIFGCIGVDVGQCSQLFFCHPANLVCRSQYAGIGYSETSGCHSIHKPVCYLRSAFKTFCTLRLFLPVCGSLCWARYVSRCFALAVCSGFTFYRYRWWSFSIQGGLH